MPERRDGLRLSAGDRVGIPSFADALFGRGRKWVTAALCAEEPYSEWKWVIEPSTGGIEYPGAVVKRIEVCAQCPVQRECLIDALREDSYTIEGVWGGTARTERRAALRQVGETMMEPTQQMTWQNDDGTVSRSAAKGAGMFRADRQKLAERVADLLLQTYPDRLERWKQYAERRARASTAEGI